MPTVIDLIGSTPIVKLEKFSRKNCDIFAKLEGQNIGGSIKDRVALALIEDLEKKEVLKKDMTILEPSSGNTGIGLAIIGAMKGYKVEIMIPENATPEKIALLKFLGAKIRICSKNDWSGNEAIIKCKKLAKDNDNYVMPNQYENPVCVQIHHDTTGEEITRQSPAITHLVATMGTGGTITGIAKRLKKHNSHIKIIGVEIRPDSTIPGPRSLLHYVPPILELELIDKRVMIEDEKHVHDIHSQLAKSEGLFCGLSSAATLKVAKDIADKPSGETKKNIVCIFPDRGEKYLSTLTGNSPLPNK